MSTINPIWLLGVVAPALAGYMFMPLNPIARFLCYMSAFGGLLGVLLRQWMDGRK